jgi:hypothetical protein
MNTKQYIQQWISFLWQFLFFLLVFFSTIFFARLPFVPFNPWVTLNDTLLFTTYVLGSNETMLASFSHILLRKLSASRSNFSNALSSRRTFHSHFFFIQYKILFSHILSICSIYISPVKWKHPWYWILWSQACTIYIQIWKCMVIYLYRGKY